MWHMLAVALAQLALVVIAGTVMLYVASRLIVRYLNNQFNKEFVMIENTTQDNAQAVEALKGKFVGGLRALADSIVNVSGEPSREDTNVLGMSYATAIGAGYITRDTGMTLLAGLAEKFADANGSREMQAETARQLADAVEFGIPVNDANAKATLRAAAAKKVRSLVGPLLRDEAPLFALMELVEYARGAGYLDEGAQTQICYDALDDAPSPAAFAKLAESFATAIEEERKSGLDDRNLLALKLRLEGRTAEVNGAVMPENQMVGVLLLSEARSKGWLTQDQVDAEVRKIGDERTPETFSRLMQALASIVSGIPADRPVA